MNKTRDIYKMEQNSTKSERLYETPVENFAGLVRIILAIQGIVQLPPTTFLRNLRPRSVASVEGESLQRDLIRKATYWLHGQFSWQRDKSKRWKEVEEEVRRRRRRFFIAIGSKNFCSSRLVSFELFTIRSNWPRAINVIYQRCNLLRGAFSIVWVNSFHRRSRGRLQKKRITTEVNKKRRERETGWKFSALLPGGGSASLPVNDGSIVVSDNFYNKPVKRLLFPSPFFLRFFSQAFTFLHPFLPPPFFLSLRDRRCIDYSDSDSLWIKITFK